MIYNLSRFRTTYTDESKLFLSWMNFSTFCLSLNLELKFTSLFILEIKINCFVIIYYTFILKIIAKFSSIYILIYIIICYLTNCWLRDPWLNLECWNSSVDVESININRIIWNHSRFFSAFWDKYLLFTEPKFATFSYYFQIIIKGPFFFFI